MFSRTKRLLPRRQFFRIFVCAFSVLLILGLSFYAMVLESRIDILRLRSTQHCPSQTFDYNGYKTLDPQAEALNYVIFDAFDYRDSLEFLNNPEPGWTVVVINSETHKLNESSCKDCLFFSSEMAQRYLDLQIGNVTIESFLASKMAVYLYVLSKNANWIYTMDKPLDVPYSAFNRVVNKNGQITSGIVYKGPDDIIFEPCQHLVDPFMWSPSVNLSDQNHFLLRPLSNATAFFVVDECLKSNMEQNSLRSSIDIRGPLLYVMPGTFAALDFNNVLVSRDTAWTLLASLPDQTSPGYSLNKIKMKYNVLIQRILWETNAQIGFIPSLHNSRRRCLTCRITGRYEDIGMDFIRNVGNWRCEPGRQIHDCLAEVALDLFEEFFLDESIPTVFGSWIQWIRSDRIPQVKRSPLTKRKLYNIKMIGRDVFFTPVKSQRYSIDNSEQELINPFSDICSNTFKAHPTFSSDTRIFRTMLLIVIIRGSKQEDLIPLLDYQYGRHFLNIAYCTTDATYVSKLYAHKHEKTPVTIIHANRRVLLAYECVKAAIRMNYDVTGYMLVDHLVLVNLWKFYNLPLDQAWFQGFSHIARLQSYNQSGSVDSREKYLSSKKVYSISSLFSSRESKSLIMSFRKLDKLKRDPDIGERVAVWLENLKAFTKCDYCVLEGKTDIFHLPASLASEFVLIMDTLSVLDTPLDVTIPSTLAILADDRGILLLRGKSTPKEMTATDYNKLYNEKDFYFKISNNATFADKLYSGFYCLKYLHHLDDDLKKNAENVVT